MNLRESNLPDNLRRPEKEGSNGKHTVVTTIRWKIYTRHILAADLDCIQDSGDDDEYRSRRPHHKSKEGSMTETTSDDDGEYHGGAVEPISACGTLDVAVQYSMSEQKLQVTIIEAHDLPSRSRGGFSVVQVQYKNNRSLHGVFTGKFFI